MATKADICNLALSTLGDSATVTAIDSPDGSPQAGHCARFYPIALRQLMEEADRSFLTRRQRLAALSSLDEETYSWKFGFSVPSNCVRIIKLEAVHFRERRTIDYELEMDPSNASRLILCNEESPVLSFVALNDNPSIYPTYFINALVPLLASMLVGPLKQADASSTESRNLLALYQQALSLAKTADAFNARHRGRRRERLAPHLRARIV